MNHPNIQLILGPPGTGKTTRLLTLLEKTLRTNAPNKVAFVSFTRKAAMEAKERARTRFGYAENELPWFRTLHSMAYRCLNLTKDDVFDRNDCITLGRQLGLYISYGQNFDDEEQALSSAGSKGTTMLFLDNLARITERPLEEVWKNFRDDSITFLELEWFAGMLAKYKEQQCVVDFTDMITRVATDRGTWVPSLDVVFVDEAQDLTRAQWRMVERISRGAKTVYIGGDDDQSIYTWSGADIHTFLHLPAKKVENLEVSYRLPRSVFNYAEQLLTRIQERYPKKWRPRDEEGLVKHVFSYEETPLGTGSWLILSRNRCFAKEASEYCREMGFHFYCPFEDSVDLEVLEAIRNWEKLRKGAAITGKEARAVVEWMKVGEAIARGSKKLPGLEDNDLVTLKQLVSSHGVKTKEIWHQALGRIPAVQSEHIIAMLQNGEKLSRPRITISTIHGAKGGEADNVLLISDITKRTADNLMVDPDSEHRVFYVGATRARHNLYLFCPTGRDHYDLPTIQKGE